MEKFQYVLLAFIPLLFSLSFHEAAHAWMANRLGDQTAKMLGRLTLNPVPHIDPIGTILFPLLGFFTNFGIIGWARPVPVNERNLRNSRTGGLWVAAAGPLSNLILALGFTAVAYVLVRTQAVDQPLLSMAGISVFEPLAHMAFIGIRLNVLLAFFNLIPLPPLDGGRVLVGFFPGLAPSLRSLERYGFLILLVLLNFGLLDSWVFRPASILAGFLTGLAQG